MKKLLSLLQQLRSWWALSLVLMFTVATAHASTGFEVGAVIDPMTELRNPVSGLASLRLSNTRIGVSLGNNERLSAMVDVIAINKQGLSLAVGVVADRVNAEDYTANESSNDTTITVAPHDHGRHLGDKHKRKGKTTTTTSGFNKSLTLFGQDWNLAPSLSVGIPLPLRGFIESRVVFTAGEVSNRSSVGIRF